MVLDAGPDVCQHEHSLGHSLGHPLPLSRPLSRVGLTSARPSVMAHNLTFSRDGWQVRA
jgi:hypothetical protein